MIHGYPTPDVIIKELAKLLWRKIRGKKEKK